LVVAGCAATLSDWDTQFGLAWLTSPGVTRHGSNAAALSCSP
jgi:hypothetical protein